ncbi:MAG TPA: HAD family hydrolase [Acidimicrobiales bacterium]|nr:HAD family hydrolase [Acidimicrobiales bacterium]
MTLSRAVFLDRDGIINVLWTDPRTGQPGSPLDVESVRLQGEIAREIIRFREAGYLLVGVTNQPSAAKGRISMVQQDAIHERVLDLLSAEGVALDAWKICPHHPDGIVKELALSCSCRKPKPGMLIDAAREFNINIASSWMIGDSDSDVEAGRAAGTRTILIGAPTSLKRSHAVFATSYCATFKEAVDIILEQGCS